MEHLAVRHDIATSISTDGMIIYGNITRYLRNDYPRFPLLWTAFGAVNRASAKNRRACSFPASPTRPSTPTRYNLSFMNSSNENKMAPHFPMCSSQDSKFNSKLQKTSTKITPKTSYIAPQRSLRSFGNLQFNLERCPIQIVPRTAWPRGTSPSLSFSSSYSLPPSAL